MLALISKLTKKTGKEIYEQPSTLRNVFKDTVEGLLVSLKDGSCTDARVIKSLGNLIDHYEETQELPWIQARAIL